MALGSFIFNPSKGETPETVARRRAVAEALMRGSRPRTFGEGLSALGDGIAASINNRRANRAESEGMASASEAFAPIAKSFLGGGEGGTAPAGGGNYRDAIASIESAGSGDYKALGPVTKSGDRAYGRYQVMGNNVGPWSKAALGRELTPDQFLADPASQDAIFDKQFGGYVDQFGSPNAAAQAWFGGPGSVGKSDRKDMLGTSVGEYGQKFDRALGGSPQQPLQMAQAGGPDAAAIMQALSNPWLSDGQKMIAKALLAQQMEASDPDKKLAREKTELEIQNLRDPKPDLTDDMREYNFAVEQGFQGSLTDYILEQKRAGAQKTYGAPPAGFRYEYDDAGNPVQAVPVPGSPASAEAEAAKAKQNEQAGQADVATRVVTSAASRAREAAKERNFGPYGQNLAQKMPWTDSAEVSRQVDVLKSQAKVENLTAMRQASPTGGALGSVTEKEADMLASKSGALDPSSPTFERDLDDYELTLLQVIHGPEAGTRIFESSRGAQDGAASSAAGKPISEMTDEELEAIINGN